MALAELGAELSARTRAMRLLWDAHCSDIPVKNPQKVVEVESKDILKELQSRGEDSNGSAVVQFSNPFRDVAGSEDDTVRIMDRTLSEEPVDGPTSSPLQTSASLEARSTTTDEHSNSHSHDISEVHIVNFVAQQKEIETLRSALASRDARINHLEATSTGFQLEALALDTTSASKDAQIFKLQAEINRQKDFQLEALALDTTSASKDRQILALQAEINAHKEVAAYDLASSKAEAAEAWEQAKLEAFRLHETSASKDAHISDLQALINAQKEVAAHNVSSSKAEAAEAWEQAKLEALMVHETNSSKDARISALQAEINAQKEIAAHDVASSKAEAAEAWQHAKLEALMLQETNVSKNVLISDLQAKINAQQQVATQALQQVAKIDKKDCVSCNGVILDELAEQKQMLVGVQARAVDTESCHRMQNQEAQNEAMKTTGNLRAEELSSQDLAIDEVATCQRLKSEVAEMKSQLHAANVAQHDLSKEVDELKQSFCAKAAVELVAKATVSALNGDTSLEVQPRAMSSEKVDCTHEKVEAMHTMSDLLAEALTSRDCLMREEAACQQLKIEAAEMKNQLHEEKVAQHDLSTELEDLKRSFSANVEVAQAKLEAEMAAFQEKAQLEATQLRLEQDLKHRRELQQVQQKACAEIDACREETALAALEKKQAEKEQKYFREKLAQDLKAREQRFEERMQLFEVELKKDLQIQQQGLEKPEKNVGAMTIKQFEEQRSEYEMQLEVFQRSAQQSMDTLKKQYDRELDLIRRAYQKELEAMQCQVEAMEGQRSQLIQRLNLVGEWPECNNDISGQEIQLIQKDDKLLCHEKHIDIAQQSAQCTMQSAPSDHSIGAQSLKQRNDATAHDFDLLKQCHATLASELEAGKTESLHSFKIAMSPVATAESSRTLNSKPDHECESVPIASPSEDMRLGREPFKEDVSLPSKVCGLREGPDLKEEICTMMAESSQQDACIAVLAADVSFEISNQWGRRINATQPPEGMNKRINEELAKVSALQKEMEKLKAFKSQLQCSVSSDSCLNAEETAASTSSMEERILNPEDAGEIDVKDPHTTAWEECRALLQGKGEDDDKVQNAFDLPPKHRNGTHDPLDLELSTTTASETIFSQSPLCINAGETPEKESWLRSSTWSSLPIPDGIPHVVDVEVEVKSKSKVLDVEVEVRPTESASSKSPVKSSVKHWSPEYYKIYTDTSCNTDLHKSSFEETSTSVDAGSSTFSSPAKSVQPLSWTQNSSLCRDFNKSEQKLQGGDQKVEPATTSRSDSRTCKVDVVLSSKFASANGKAEQYSMPSTIYNATSVVRQKSLPSTGLRRIVEVDPSRGPRRTQSTEKRLTKPMVMQSEHRIVTLPPQSLSNGRPRSPSPPLSGSMMPLQACLPLAARRVGTQSPLLDPSKGLLWRS